MNVSYTGIDRRMARLFAGDGRSLVLAFDHGAQGANHAGMADPARTLTDAVAAGADAVLTTVGQALRFGQIIRTIGLAINLDDLIGDPAYAVDQALALGADMGKVIAFPGSVTDPESVARAARLSAICRARNFPLMIEPIPGGFERIEEHTAEKIGLAARQAAEIGADLLKIQYTGDEASFRQVLAPLFRPTIVLGGPSRGNIRGVLEDVHGAMQAGAVGIAIGRNIWADPQPGKVIAAMGAIIHGNATVDEAMRELA
ncbi:MAG: hypothetical protein IT337_09035 [Thermomicrobiales bacterium]|nr:hypothetical protein [Thermomicrobiales bacterium]